MEFAGQAVQVLTLVYLRDADGRILMLRRGAHKKFLPGWLVAPGGKVEPGEEIEAGARREYVEETGLTLDKVSLRGSYTFMTTTPGNRAGVIYLFVAEGFTGVFKAEVADGELGWYGVDELLASEVVMEDHKVFMREILQNDGVMACIGAWENGEGIGWADSAAYFEQRKLAA